MTNSPISSIEDLKSALLRQNPFNEVSVRHQNIWGQGFPDVESLNAHASNAVYQAIDQNRTTTIVITAEYGTGKSHIISRIRHHLQNQSGALFVYANKYGDINQIKQGFQRILGESLRNIGSQEVRQWQELATAMVNQALKVHKPSVNTLSPKELVNKFENIVPEQVNKFINNFTRAFCKIKDVSDPDIVRAIFWTLSDEQILFAAKWLEGEEIAQFKANELGLPTQRKSFEAVLQILDLISEYNTLVLCFDELDNPEYSDAGFTRAQIVAGLVKELFENLKRGVILSVMIPAVWKDKVKPMPSLSWRKISDYGEPIDLRFMDENSVVELVTLRLREFYQSQKLVPPHPVFPFTESQLKDIGRTKSATVREVLTWCRDTLPKMLNDRGTKPPTDPVELAFNTELKEDLGNYLDDNFMIADALFFGFQTLIGQTVERVTIEEVTDKVRKRGGKDSYINFKVIGKENGQDVGIGVAVLQDAGGKALGAGLKRLNDYETFGMTRGCLVRSKNKKITSYLEKTYLEPLIRGKGGEFVELKEDEIKPLIAIRAVHQKREVDYKEYKLDEEQISNFIAEKGAEKILGANNPLLKEILSDPSYEVPTDMIEEEPEILVESSRADVIDSDDVIDLMEN
jgi:hypothetical protein